METILNKFHYKLTPKHLTFLAILTALCSVSRMVFTWIPNFTPVTSIFLLVCLNFSLIDAIIVANLTMLATGVYLGMGYWVFCQMISYTVVILLFYLVTRFWLFRKMFPMMVIDFICGLLYGFIISVLMVAILKSNFWVYYSAGVSFDLMHATGNFLFTFLLYVPFKSFRKYYLTAVNS